MTTELLLKIRELHGLRMIHLLDLIREFPEVKDEEWIDFLSTAYENKTLIPSYADSGDGYSLPHSRIAEWTPEYFKELKAGGGLSVDRSMRNEAHRYGIKDVELMRMANIQQGVHKRVDWVKPTFLLLRVNEEVTDEV